MEMRRAVKFSKELYLNSVDVPSDSTARIGEMAKKYGTYVVIGINERDNKSIYNTLLFFDRKGHLMGKHRKFKPTGAEKLVWGEGDGSTHKVYDTDIGRVGGLICGEHTMALPGYTLGAMGEQVHIASWVGFSFSDTTLSEICSRYHAIAYDAFVICSQSILDDQVNKKLGLELKVGGAYTAIIEAGTGRIMAGPLAPAEEGIVYADIDLNDAVAHYFVHEPTGHYWPKQFRVFFDAREMKPLNFGKGPAARESGAEGEAQGQEFPKDTCE
jgi:aliphatic nitrilase